MIRYARSPLAAPTTKRSSLRERSMLFFAFNGGAYAEDESTYGLHHFLEHLMFKNWAHVEATATRKCVKFNAVTDDDRVYFYVTGLNDGVVDVVNALRLDRGFVSTPSRRDFETERGVLLQEYDSMRTHRPSIIITGIQRRYFQYYSPFGRRSVLENVTYKEMLRCLDWFSKPSSVLLVAGDGVSLDIKSWACGKNELFTPVPKAPRGLDSVEYDDPCGSDHETIVCDFAYCGDMSDVDVAYIKALWADGNDSPVNLMIREKHGLAYAATLYHDRPCSSVFAYITTAERHVKRVRKMLLEMYRNYEKHITRKRFREVQEMLITRRRLLNSNTCSLGFAEHITSPVSIGSEQFENRTYEQALHACEVFSRRAVVPCSFGRTLRLGGV